MYRQFYHSQSWLTVSQKRGEGTESISSPPPLPHDARHLDLASRGIG
jgi:hypothetical protein